MSQKESEFFFMYAKGGNFQLISKLYLDPVYLENTFKVPR